MLLSGDIFQLHNSKNASACQSAKGEKCCQAGVRLSAENFLGQSQSRPPCGARKNLRTIRSLDFFDRYGFPASLHPPPAALGSESPSPAKRASSSFLLAFGGASLLDNLVSTARRRGVPFTRVKGTKTRLGRCPKTPIAGCAGYGLIFDGSPKSIRTAHRIAPKVAAGASALSPHPLSRCGKGARMGWQLQIDSNVLGVLGLAKSQAANPKVFVYQPPSSPPLRRGQGWWFALPHSSAGAIKMRLRHLISTV